MTTARVNVIFAVFLAAMALFTGYLQYFAQPAHCWTPPEFTRSMVDYTNSACYFASAYYLPIYSPIPEPEPTTKITNYYKWTPFGLLFLAILYVIPEIINSIAYNMFKVDLGSIHELSRQCSTETDETKLAAIKHLTADLQYRLDEYQRMSRETGLRRCLMKISPSLSLYAWLQQLAGKLCLLVGSIVPVFLLYKCVGLDFDYYDTITNNKLPTNETYFPEQTLCDFAIRRYGYIRRYTVQCHLPANDMFERISLLVGFLALVVSSVSSSDVICCFVGRLFESRNSKYVRRHIESFTEKVNDYSNEEYEDFTERCLRADVVYLLRLIGQNSSEMVVCQILSRLWARWVEVSGWVHPGKNPRPSADCCREASIDWTAIALSVELFCESVDIYHKMTHGHFGVTVESAENRKGEEVTSMTHEHFSVTAESNENRKGEEVTTVAREHFSDTGR